MRINSQASPCRPTRKAKRKHWIKDFRCFDANGTLLTSPTAAASAVLTNWPGYQYKFDIFNLSLPPGPADAVAWWKFDEGSGQTASDSSGNGNTGTLVSNPSWVTGEAGTALSFNGQSNYVDAGNPADLNIQGQITLAAWVNMPSQQQGGNPYAMRPIIAHGATAGSQNTMPQNAAVFMYVNQGTIYAGAQRPFNPQNLPAQSMVSHSLNSSEDYGYWVHWAATYDGANWNLYRNGVLVQSTAGSFGAQSVTDYWCVGGAYNAGVGRQYFSGTIDDARVYSRALGAYEVAGLAQQAMMAGRLKSITDPNGYAVTITHPTFTAQQLAQSPDLQWQVDTVTDPYGRQATFGYLPTQVSGQWAVSQINFPNGHKAVYNYANGQLASVAFDDSTTSTFTYGTDAASDTSTVQFFDVAADGSHRSKTVYLTNKFTDEVPTDIKALLINQSSLVARMVTNGAGEVSFLGVFNNPADSPLDLLAYQGAGCSQGSRTPRRHSRSPGGPSAIRRRARGDLTPVGKPPASI